jgi:acyl-coenzyme A synthetase/AMP-(fatty) acid ligase
MAAFKRPRQIHVVSELPKTATGKIQRFALRARVGAVSPADALPNDLGGAAATR